MEFDPSSCVGFDRQIRIQGTALYEKLKESLKDKPYLNVDETGWKGKWLWCYADHRHAVYRIESGRGQKELKGILGDSYKGIPSHNNLVERLLRTSVIMRKITFGNRSREGELNHEVIMSLVQTLKKPLIPYL